MSRLLATVSPSLVWDVSHQRAIHRILPELAHLPLAPHRLLLILVRSGAEQLRAEQSRAVELDH
jgi:hypothetical protein